MIPRLSVVLDIVRGWDAQDYIGTHWFQIETSLNPLRMIFQIRSDLLLHIKISKHEFTIKDDKAHKQRTHHYQQPVKQKDLDLAKETRYYII